MTDTKNIPLHDRVVVRRAEPKRKTETGVELPRADKDKPIFGQVVATGPGKRHQDGRVYPPSVKVGDRVLFSKYSTTEVEIETLLVMREDDIMAVLPSS